MPIPIMVSIFAQILCPYQVKIFDNPTGVVMINESVVATTRNMLNQATPFFFDRSSEKQIESDEGLQRLGPFLRSSSTQLVRILGKHYKISYLPGSTASAAAVSGDIKVGSLTVNEPLILRDSLVKLDYDYPLMRAGSTLACAWIGEKNEMVVLPPIPNDLIPQREPGPEDAVYFPFATDGVGVVGMAYRLMGAGPRAVHWNLTTRRGRSLHPAGADQSTAMAIDGGSIVGGVTINRVPHAVLWANEGKPVILDRFALAHGVRGNVQVGSSGQSVSGAMMWRGTPGSRVRLYAYLPKDIISSTAMWIAEDGTIYGVGLKEGSRRHVGIEWKPNPIYKAREGFAK